MLFALIDMHYCVVSICSQYNTSTHAHDSGMNWIASLRSHKHTYNYYCVLLAKTSSAKTCFPAKISSTTPVIHSDASPCRAGTSVLDSPPLSARNAPTMSSCRSFRGAVLSLVGSKKGGYFGNFRLLSHFLGYFLRVLAQLGGLAW